MAVIDILGRLERVKQTSPGNWRAICPVHVSKHRSQSLQVSERPDGSIGIYCYAGCDVGTIVHVLGLEISDLFAEPLTKERLRPSRRTISPEDTLDVLANEAAVVMLAGAEMLENRRISEADWQRLSTAVGRITSAMELHNGR